MHPTAARGQPLPQRIGIKTIRAAIMHSLGADAVRRALGPSRVLDQVPNARPNQ
jgi:hypothetical protein